MSTSKQTAVGSDYTVGDVWRSWHARRLQLAELDLQNATTKEAQDEAQHRVRSHVAAIAGIDRASQARVAK